ncbi:hypothetical protein ACHHYP_20510 [Achlya hypogyna]|uniref:Methyltransferase domain-containing protein n=1 Tax=Achlya hypogyna TaxID=1202772 RepID=A0A1V9YK76_ACHHY|nr:hypothetical protein ACHHYP_20510 [Achlya hypogyna]
MSDSDGPSLLSSALSVSSSYLGEPESPSHLHSVFPLEPPSRVPWAVPRVIHGDQIVDARCYEHEPCRGIDMKQNVETPTSDDGGDELRPVAALIPIHRRSLLPQTTPTRQLQKLHPYIEPVTTAFLRQSRYEWYLPYDQVHQIVQVYVRRGHSVVDLGAGQSRLAVDMVLRGYKNVMAVDVDLDCIRAQTTGIDPALLPFLRVLRMDATALGFASRTIDAVIAKAFFELLPEATQCAVLDQLAACLKPGGILIAISLDDPGWWTTPAVSGKLADNFACVDATPVGPIVGVPWDRHQAFRAMVWRTHESPAEAAARAAADAAEDFAAGLEWRLRRFEQVVAVEEVTADDVMCTELPVMMGEDLSGLLMRQNANCVNNQRDIADAARAEPAADEDECGFALLRAN